MVKYSFRISGIINVISNYIKFLGKFMLFCILVYAMTSTEVVGSCIEYKAMLFCVQFLNQEVRIGQIRWPGNYWKMNIYYFFFEVRFGNFFFKFFFFFLTSHKDFLKVRFGINIFFLDWVLQVQIWSNLYYFES